MVISLSLTGIPLKCYLTRVAARFRSSTEKVLLRFRADVLVVLSIPTKYLIIKI